MNFGDALEFLKSGNAVTRKGWNGKGMWLELQTPDEHSKMTLPYIYMNYPKGEKYPNGCRVPWLASQTDMLSEDWALFDNRFGVIIDPVSKDSVHKAFENTEFQELLNKYRSEPFVKIFFQQTGRGNGKQYAQEHELMIKFIKIILKAPFVFNRIFESRDLEDIGFNSKYFWGTITDEEYEFVMECMRKWTNTFKI